MWRPEMSSASSGMRSSSSIELLIVAKEINRTNGRRALAYRNTHRSSRKKFPLTGPILCWRRFD
jgi:hypothetical protein